MEAQGRTQWQATLLQLAVAQVIPGLPVCLLVLWAECFPDHISHPILPFWWQPTPISMQALTRQFRPMPAPCLPLHRLPRFKRKWGCLFQLPGLMSPDIHSHQHACPLRLMLAGIRGHTSPHGALAGHLALHWTTIWLALHGLAVLPAMVPLLPSSLLALMCHSPTAVDYSGPVKGLGD